jgi:hypothetical protein
MATEFLPSRLELKNCHCFDAGEKSNPCLLGNRDAGLRCTPPHSGAAWHETKIDLSQRSTCSAGVSCVRGNRG